MKGIGTDESRIIKEICAHTKAERQEIQRAYLAMYGKSLEEDLESEVDGDFLKGLKALLKPTSVYEAECLEKSMKGLGTNEEIMIELLCTKNGQEIRDLAEAYHKRFGKNLHEEVSEEENGDLGRIFKSISSGNRDDSTYSDQHLANKEAQELYDAGQGTTGTDEIEFIRIFCSRSFAQLRETFIAYRGIADNDIEKAIKKEFGGHMELALLTIAKSVKNRAAYFAERLHESMEGVGTKESDLIRILACRSEVDLAQIKNEYQNLYGKSLYDRVKSELGGDFEKLLITLIGKH